MQGSALREWSVWMSGRAVHADADERRHCVAWTSNAQCCQQQQQQQQTGSDNAATDRRGLSWAGRGLAYAVDQVGVAWNLSVEMTDDDDPKRRQRLVASRTAQ